MRDTEITMTIKHDDLNDGAYMVEICDNGEILIIADNFSTVEDAREYIKQWCNFTIMNEVE